MSSISTSATSISGVRPSASRSGGNDQGSKVAGCWVARLLGRPSYLATHLPITQLPSYRRQPPRFPPIFTVGVERDAAVQRKVQRFVRTIAAKRVQQAREMRHVADEHDRPHLTGDPVAHPPGRIIRLQAADGGKLGERV